MSIRFLAQGEEPERDPELRAKLFAVCGDASVNVVLQALVECLMISVITASANAAEAQTMIDEIARVMCRDVQKAWREVDAMRRKRAQ
jgi:hypothetical protein